MTVIRNEAFINKANDLKRPLKSRTVYPRAIVEIKQDPTAFQGLRAVPVGECNLPLLMNSGDKVLLDFGDHCVGYLSFALNHLQNVTEVSNVITDSPARFKFSFGEFPLEIVTPHEEYHGQLGSGWLQYEEKTVVFTPYSGSLERRYAFRYLLIERLDTSKVPVEFTDISATCVSAVDLSDVKPFEIEDETLQKIYDASLKTLRDCEQDVFEDGPKRDRRLWSGDLRLQALTDYMTFQNDDLIKRCIYLFAGYRTEQKLVAQCIFPDSPPHIYAWLFADYSLFFISFLYDYMKNREDMALLEELYPVALEQAEVISSKFDEEKGIINFGSFIDWCAGLDKSVALLGVYIYTLKQLKALATALGKPTIWIEQEIEKMKAALLRFYSEKDGLFVTASGQISWHSQVWAVLSGVLSKQENIALLENIQKADTVFTMRTPYMMHYYIEALYTCGLKAQAIEFIKTYWGQILACGYDCCPEVFNPENQFESPYGGPETNSACHAWSCTPAYWMHKFYSES